MEYEIDNIILHPKQIDLKFSPLRSGISEETYLLGAFNPGLARLPNGNMLMMVRIAEALTNLVNGNQFNVIRWNDTKYEIDRYAIDDFSTTDPRKYKLKNSSQAKVYALTSFSWLLPIELNSDGLEIVNIHYDKCIQPEESYMEYGIEDARITKIENTYYMTACTVSSLRHSTVLYSSEDGLNYSLLGMIQDHQNKDMVLFPERIYGKYFALTRPLGEHYFVSGQNSNLLPGPTIQIASSPDLIHWKPNENDFLPLLKNSKISMKTGGGCPPILTDEGWLVFFHGVEPNDDVGIYRTFWALCEKEMPYKIIHVEINSPVLIANPNLTDTFNDKHYVKDVVFSTGIVEDENNYIIASGELDQYCRITYIPKNIIRDQASI